MPSSTSSRGKRRVPGAHDLVEALVYREGLFLELPEVLLSLILKEYTKILKDFSVKCGLA